MSQHVQSPQPQGQQTGYQAQTQTGQAAQQTQPGQFAAGVLQSEAGQFIGQQYQQSVPQEIQQAVDDLDRLENVCEWLVIRAAERGMIPLAERSKDIANIAHLEKKLLLRQSPFAEPIRGAIQQTIQEFQQYAGEPEVQESLSHAQQALDTINTALERIQTAGQQVGQQPTRQAQQPSQQMGAQPGVQQPSQQMGGQRSVRQPSQQRGSQQIRQPQR
ncbi:hypothetical protein [Natrinema caseinilyticum]|uniref:hypothetical protein n=1 Tax=Natrinema caseinilyticum TaxID=2961570 RepID=UPI0020C371BB|nr:hypothetical protein [Natrinema caseinilyticum]